VNNARYVDVVGTRTRYFDAGNGPPLVLVHGGGYATHWNAEDWEHNFDDLATTFRVVAVDKIGSGFSDNPKADDQYLIGTTVQHLRRFIETLGLGPVIVAGHSRGGYTVTRLALEHPELVDVLVIVSSSSLMTAPNPQYGVWYRESMKFDDLRDRYRYLITENSYGDAHITERYLDVVVEIDQLEKTRAARPKLDGGLEARFKADLVERQVETHAMIRAGGLRCPTLILWGYDDPSATMERCGIPCMNLILPAVERSEMHVLNRAGHSVFREQPAGFNSTLRDFVRRYGSRP
jgi:pimeloyl-ACP methyl ester carboxylesterase